MIDQVRDILQQYGVYTLVILYIAKYATGVFVALDLGEFKAFYLDENLRKDALKIVVYAALTGLGKVPELIPVFGTEEMRAGLGALLAASLAAGVVKNLVHLFPEFGNNVPTSFREPARLRLGNPRNVE
jgi:hypothetical protein